MTQKTISLTERAYNLLKKEKKNSESFSDIIERLITKPENPWLKWKGKFDPELWDGLEDKLRKIREEDLVGGE